MAGVTSKRCRFSFVVTSRNDDFGGGALERMNLFTNNLIELCDRHQLQSEIIVVEWNPPRGPRLHDVLRPEKKSAYVTIRFIEVPPHLHESLPNSDKLPLFQMIAKNVGILRSRGEFVIATNHDILFSDALIETLATTKLDRDCIYRINRTDVAAEVPAVADTDHQLAWCKEHILRVHRRRGTLNGPPLFELDWLLDPGLSLLARNARSVAARGLRSLARRIPRWIGSSLRLVRAFFQRARHIRPRQVLRAIVGGLGVGRHMIAKSLFILAKVADPKPRLHTNACGDFTMLSRHHWLALRGYPEIPLYSLHIDSFFLCVASAAGLQERTFHPSRRIYHLEHSTSWAAVDAEERVRWFSRMPWIEYRLVEDLWTKMRREHRPFLFNDEDWGFGAHDLLEVVLRDGSPELIERAPSAATRGSAADTLA